MEDLSGQGNRSAEREPRLNEVMNDLLSELDQVEMWAMQLVDTLGVPPEPIGVEKTEASAPISHFSVMALHIPDMARRLQRVRQDMARIAHAMTTGEVP
jgi:hypothetical protein